MSRRNGAATSRRTRRGELQPPAFAATGSVVSNPIFLCEDGSAGRLIRPGGGGGGYEPAEEDGGMLLPLPLPPSRAHREGRGGTRVPAWHVGPTNVVGPHGAVLRKRPPQQDPFLAAYVACTKGRTVAGAGKNSGQAKKKNKKKAKAGTRGGCGMWSGWATGARYAGVMSCRHGSAVTVLQGAAPLPAGVANAESPEHPTLDLSRLPAVLPGRRRPHN